MEHQDSHTLLERVHFYNFYEGQFRNIHQNDGFPMAFDLEILLIEIYLKHAFTKGRH